MTRVKAIRMKFYDRVKDCKPFTKDHAHLAMYSSAHHDVEQDTDGNWHVYRKSARAEDQTRDDSFSEGGVTDPHFAESKLANKLKTVDPEKFAEINRRNAEFWEKRKP